MKPNLLFITVDQMRWDCLSALGHPIVETPNLDHLMKQGVLFKNAYSATPICIPARAAIMTGMAQRSHGRIGYAERVPWNYEPMLAGELAKANYHTQCVGKMHVYPTRNLCGFHNVVLHDGYLHHNKRRNSTLAGEHYDVVDDYLHWLRQTAGAQHDLSDHGLDCNASTIARPWHMEEQYHPTNWTVTESIDFLRRRDPSKPFFLWTSFVRPHSPLDPPQVYFDMYKDMEMPDSPIGDWVDIDAAAEGAYDPTTIRGQISRRRLNRAKAGYYGLITHLDDQIGRLFNALQEHDLHRNTVIIFTSDHGELMGDHHYFRKGLPYEGSAKIPFILADPGGVLGLEAGACVDEVIELRDIMPTFLEVADAPIPPSVEGKSVLSLARKDGSGSAESWRSYVHGEHALGQLSNQFITDGKQKYIWFSQTGEEQLFDLVQDPQELVNVAGEMEYSEQLMYWRSILIKELDGREEGYVSGEKLIVGRTPQVCLSHILE